MQFNKKKSLKLTYQVPIIEGLMNGAEFIINGTAINSITTSNNHKFLAEELKSATSSLNGVPLLIDHKNEVSAIKGRVISSEYDENSNNIKFKAIIKDKEIQNLITSGLLNTVSVGAEVEDIEESDGLMIPKGINFKELSLVAVPADPGATFTMALHEAYQLSHSSKVGNLIDDQIKQQEVKKMSEANETVKTEVVAKAEKVSEKVEEKIDYSKIIAEAVKNAILPLQEEIKSLKEAEKPVEKKEETEFDDEGVKEISGIKFRESLGGLRGMAYSVIR